MLFQHCQMPHRYCGAAVCLLLAILSPGCLSLSTPEHVVEHRSRIKTDLNVEVDISSASSFTGDVGTVLAEIERAVAPLPPRYREKLGTIKVVDGMFFDYLLMAPFVGAFTTNDGTVYIRNANIGRFLQMVFIFQNNDTLIHELMHSVHFREMHDWQTTGEPSVEFAVFLKAWEYQYFGDVTGDGEIDDRDMAHVAAHPAEFDANGDGRIDHLDVEELVGNPYVSGNWISLKGAVVMAGMSLNMLAPRPSGFASSYAKTFVWEDAAETYRYLWGLRLVPALYSLDSTPEAREAAWERFNKLRKKDPLLARKVMLIVRYIAQHEEPHRLASAWTTYLAHQRGEGNVRVAVSKNE